MSTPLNIPDLPATVSVTNQLARMVRIPGIRDIPASATITVTLTGISEARKLRRWKNLKRAVAAGVLAYVAPDALWGTIRIKNLTATMQSFGGLILPLAANEIRDINLVDNITVSRRIRLWKAIRNANNGSLVTIETAPANDTPTVTSCSPATLDLAGGALTIRGTDFVPTAIVRINGQLATNIVWVDSTTITCTAPAQAAGAKGIFVTNSLGHTGQLNGALSYTAVGFTSITPSTGPEAGGTPVSIVGTNIKPGATVTIDGVPLVGTTVVDSSHITGTTPVVTHLGAVDVVITNPGTGGSVATGTGAFTTT